MTETNRNLARSANVAIEDYRAGNIGLGKLISSLEAAIQSLEDLSKEQRGEYWSQWGKLEDVYAEFVDSNDDNIIKKYISIINGAISSIEELFKKLN